MQSLINMNSEIHSARLKLRPLRADDVDRLFGLFNNWSVVRLLSSPPWPYSRADAETFINGVLKPSSTEQEIPFAITIDGMLIGSVGVRLRPASEVQSAPGPNIGYWLGQPYWGRGYMMEAAGILISHIFAVWPGDTIYSGAFAENAASLRLQDKLGFSVAGRTMLYSRPRGAEFPHLNTVLTRARFRQLSL